MVARYRGGGGIEMQTGESSMGSLLDEDDEDTDDDEDDNDDDNDENNSERRICLSSYDTPENVIIAGDTETLPCGAIASDVPISNEHDTNDNHSSQAFQWTLSNWGSTQAHRRNNSGTVRVDLASPEDISLDTDNSSRVVFSAYGTTV